MKTRVFRQLLLPLCVLLSLSAPQKGAAQEPARGAGVAHTLSASARESRGAATVEELRGRIQSLLRQEQFASAYTAVKIVSLDTGLTLFEENAAKLLHPASNLKLFTVAAALERLSPGFRFKTSAYARTRPDVKGNLRGDLLIYGRGDPTFAARFDAGRDYFKAFDELAAQIVASGVRRVEGDLIGDESYFSGLPRAPGWGWEDRWYYGVEVMALPVNDNALDLTISPGAGVGLPGIVRVEPVASLLSVSNQVLTGARGGRRDVKVTRHFGENRIEISGSIPLHDAPAGESLPISQTSLLFVSMLRTALERQGVQIDGRTRTVDAATRGDLPPVSALVELASRQSPPLSLIAAETLKTSQNLYAELLLRVLGKTAGGDPAPNSAAAGIEAVKSFLRGQGIDPGNFVMMDGSGISRGNLVTVEATVQLLRRMSQSPHAQVFRDALPLAGVDGTLRQRMKGTTAANNVRAKTGLLSNSSTLSGYVTSASGERLAFSLMVNNPPAASDPRERLVDPIAVLLASFDGQSSR